MYTKPVSYTFQITRLSLEDAPVGECRLHKPGCLKPGPRLVSRFLGPRERRHYLSQRETRQLMPSVSTLHRQLVDFIPVSLIP